MKKKRKVVDITKLNKEEFQKYLLCKEKKRKMKILSFCAFLYFFIFSILIFLYIKTENIKINKEGIIQLLTISYISILGFLIFPKQKKEDEI